MPEFKTVFEANINGYDCRIVKAEWEIASTWNGEKYWYNGYVTLPKSHKWVKKSYDEIDCAVHGGLTYKEGREIGFDCNHAYDTNVAQNFEYVLKQIVCLIKQAKEAHRGKK
jgi:hypothetical protein